MESKGKGGGVKGEKIKKRIRKVSENVLGKVGGEEKETHSLKNGKLG